MPQNCIVHGKNSVVCWMYGSFALHLDPDLWKMELIRGASCSVSGNPIAEDRVWIADSRTGNIRQHILQKTAKQCWLPYIQRLQVLAYSFWTPKICNYIDNNLWTKLLISTLKCIDWLQNSLFYDKSLICIHIVGYCLIYLKSPQCWWRLYPAPTITWLQNVHRWHKYFDIYIYIYISGLSAMYWRRRARKS